MGARTTYLNSLSTFQASSPIISNLQLNPSNPSPNTDVWITAKITNAESVQLAYRSSLTDPFEKIDMLDDGNSNDGSSGDGILVWLCQLGMSDLNITFLQKMQVLPSFYLNMLPMNFIRYRFQTI